jgi:hypothetical protein
MLAALGFLLAASQSNAPIVVDGMLCHPRNLMVKYADDETLKTLRYTASVVRVFPQIHYAVVQAKPGMLRAARKQLSSWRGVRHVEYDRCAKPAYDPNDQYWPNQWDMRAIRANYAWDAQRGNPNVAVAVIDTGVFTAHPDLSDNVWVNSGEIPGNGIDDDNDGYVDDVNGYDFSHGDPMPDDVYGHGTACSGLVAAVQDNTIGVSGVAPGCKIMALKAATDDGYFYDSNDVAAYLFAADHGAKVLSMSFFGDRVSQSERDGIDYCWARGVLPVAAAGNSASVIPYYPGAYDHVLSVAAVDGNLNMAGFSDYGSWVCVSAPGVGLYTTTNDGSYTSGFAGTSGACPHVAGLAALCFSANPLATNQDVMNAIEDTATLQNQAPYGEFSLYGLVNAEMAVARMNGGAVASHPPALKYVSSIASVPVSGGVSDSAVIRGRGFENGVTLTSGGRRVPVATVSRNYIAFSPSSVPGNLTLTVNGTQVDSLTFPSVDARGAYPMNEASTQGATLTGGFKETLNPDGAVMTVSRRSDGYIVLQGTFHHVVPGSSFSLTLRRMYATTTVGTETVQLYDWSSASYPYGGFVTIGSGAVPLTIGTSTYTVNNPSRFVDPEGTVYLLVTTSADLAEGTQLRLDMAYLQSQ